MKFQFHRTTCSRSCFSSRFFPSNRSPCNFISSSSGFEHSRAMTYAMMQKSIRGKDLVSLLKIEPTRFFPIGSAIRVSNRNRFAFYSSFDLDSRRSLKYISYSFRRKVGLDLLAFGSDTLEFVRVFYSEFYANRTSFCD